MQEAHFAAPFMGTGQCLDTLNRVLAALSPGHSFHDSLRELLAALAEDMHFDRPHIVVQDPGKRRAQALAFLRPCGRARGRL